MAYTNYHIKSIAVAYLELLDFGRISNIDDYMRPRDFSKSDKRLIRVEVKKLLVVRHKSGIGKVA